MVRLQSTSTRVMASTQIQSYSSRFASRVILLSSLISLCNQLHVVYIFSLSSSPNNMLGKMMCYCRLVYLPMSYVYGKRFVGPITDLIKSLREEMYNEPYDQINWNKARNSVAKVINAIFVLYYALCQT